MNKQIISALSSLNIPVAYMQYSGPENSYVMFSVYNETETDFADDKNTSEVYYITLSYWYKEPSNKDKYKEIKNLMKQAGFFYDGGKDLAYSDKGKYGKEMDFIYKEYL